MKNFHPRGPRPPGCPTPPRPRTVIEPSQCQHPKPIPHPAVNGKVSGWDLMQCTGCQREFWQANVAYVQANGFAPEPAFLSTDEAKDYRQPGEDFRQASAPAGFLGATLGRSHTHGTAPATP